MFRKMGMKLLTYDFLVPVNYKNVIFQTHVSGLTHWGRVTHTCVSKLTIIGSDNGLSPDRRQAIIWTNAGILLIGPLGTNFSEIVIEILTFSFKKMRLKMSSVKRRPFCLGLYVLMQEWCNSSPSCTNPLIYRLYSFENVHLKRGPW